MEAPSPAWEREGTSPKAHCGTRLLGQDRGCTHLPPPSWPVPQTLLRVSFFWGRRCTHIFIPGVLFGGGEVNADE